MQQVLSVMIGCFSLPVLTLYQLVLVLSVPVQMSSMKSTILKEKRQIDLSQISLDN
jgi:hypothetical protein